MFVTRDDIHIKTLNNIDESLISFVIDFCNSFLSVFPNVFSKDELIKKINSIKSIQYSDSCFWNGYMRDFKIFIDNKYKNLDKKEIKSLLYHELIHILSWHIEKDLDTRLKNDENRCGLSRRYVLKFGGKYISAFFESEILDEIMTEHYAVKLLEFEGIEIGGKYILSSSEYEEEFVEYGGTGYRDLSGLGKVYEFLFGNLILDAKFIDGNAFRQSFNQNCGGLSICKNSNIGISAPPYCRFVNEKDILGRYKTACEIYGIILSRMDFDWKFSINEFLNMNDVFESMLPKQKSFNNIDTSIRISEFFSEIESKILLKKLRPDIIYDENDVDAFPFLAVYDVLKKIRKNGVNFDASKVSYNFFEDEEATRIIISIGDRKIFTSTSNSEYSLRIRNRLCMEFDSFSDEKRNEFNYSDFDFNNLKYAETFFKGFYAIVSDGVNYYNYHGKKIDMGPEIDFLTGDVINFDKSIDGVSNYKSRKR